MNKPFKTYNGGKAGHGVYQNIINHIPQCDIYIEPMVGNGGVLHNLQLPNHIVINDLDRSVIDKYSTDTFNVDTVDRLNLSYEIIILKYDFQFFRTRSRVFFYFDPPYHFDTRKSKRNIYKYEWTHEQHLMFLQLANSIESNCMISHYPCELYDTMLKGWRTFDFTCMTRKGQRTERLYMNYPEPAVLQDYRYAGTDYRERQRIKRKVDRHVNKLESLPNDERNAIISSIIAKYGATAESLILNNKS